MRHPCGIQGGKLPKETSAHSMEEKEKGKGGQHAILLGNIIVQKHIFARACAKGDRVLCPQLKVPRRWHFLPVHKTAVGRIQIDEKGSVEICARRGQLATSCFVKVSQLSAHRVLRFSSPNSLRSTICRYWIAACCFEQEG